MARRDRPTLKNYFKKGRFPSAVHFEDLIDSTVNKIDDGFNKDLESGLQLAPQGKSDTVMSFFKKMSESQHPDWELSMEDEEEQKGLTFNRVVPDQSGKASRETILMLNNSGHVGIKTKSPNLDLEVNGTFGSRHRIGTYRVGTVPGDGEWHNILEGLDGLQAFEVVAAIKGPPKQGKYAMTHAIALSTYGRSHNKIKQIKAHFQRFIWHRYRIDLRWRGEVHDYQLQIRTRRHFGNDPERGLCMIKYHITSLWEEEAIDELLLRQQDGVPPVAPDKKAG